MLRFGCLVLAVLAYLRAPAQPQPGPPLPVLRQRLAAAASPDTARVRALTALVDAHIYTNFDSAWAYVREARALAQRLHDAEGLYRTAGTLGILYGMRGNDEASLRQFLEQLRLSAHRPDSTRQRPQILSNMAHSYYSQGKYAAAAGLLTQARRYDTQAHDTAGVLADFNNLTQLLIKQRRLPQALHNAQAAVALARRYRHGQELAQPVLFLVSALYELHRDAAARDTLLRALPHMRSGQHQAYAQHLLLGCYRALGQLPEATRAGLATLHYARAAGMLDLVRDVQADLATVAARAGRYAQAYGYQRAADSLTTRLTRESNAKTVEDMQFKYDTERKDAQVVTLAQRVRSSRWQAGLGLGLAVVALLAAAFVLRSKRLQAEVFRQREQLRAQEAARQQEQEAARRAQAETQRQLEAAERRRLEAELAGSQRELASSALFAQQKTRLLEELTERLDALARRVPEPQRLPVADMEKAIRQHLGVAEDWENVTRHFEKVHPEFFAQLRQRHPALTATDLKQCAYVKLDLTNKDIANLLRIEPASVKISHYRIKKKLNLPEEESLRDYILSV